MLLLKQSTQRYHLHLLNGTQKGSTLYVCIRITCSCTVADPGFPMGDVDFQDGYVSKILYVKMKESGPLGGGGRAPGTPPLDPPMMY